MRKKLWIAFGVSFGLFAIFCLVIALQPSTFSVERSTTIDAPPAAAFAQVNDFQAWNGWSPWIDLDPSSKTSMSEPSSGQGATFSWSGNDQVGEGKLTILESKPDELVDVEQVFVRPMTGTARMAFTFVPAQAGTKVTWKLSGTNDFMGKAVCMFVDIDAMLGKDFERGLAKMKTAAEKSKPPVAAETP